ncbi:MAG TPA: hypothetical protein VK518_07875 [Puia sp.]|nr:hypothetical protein [Puia sp.]
MTLLINGCNLKQSPLIIKSFSTNDRLNRSNDATLLRSIPGAPAAGE